MQYGNLYELEVVPLEQRRDELAAQRRLLKERERGGMVVRLRTPLRALLCTTGWVVDRLRGVLDRAGHDAARRGTGLPGLPAGRMAGRALPALALIAGAALGSGGVAHAALIATESGAGSGMVDVPGHGEQMRALDGELGGSAGRMVTDGREGGSYRRARDGSSFVCSGGQEVIDVRLDA